MLALTGFSVAPPNKENRFVLLGGATDEPVRANAGCHWLLCGSSQLGNHFFLIGRSLPEPVLALTGSSAARPNRENDFSYCEEPQRSQPKPVLALTGSSVGSPNEENQFVLPVSAYLPSQFIGILKRHPCNLRGKVDAGVQKLR